MPRPSKIKLGVKHDVRAFTDDNVIQRWQAEAQNGAVKAADADNTITIYDQIGEDWWTGEGVTVKRVDAALRSIGEKPVTVVINSPGGDMMEGVSIYNRLREHKGEITVKVVGYAASAASLIAMAGDRIEIGAASFLMIHNAWVIAGGNRHEMREVADWLEPFDAAQVGVYAQRTGIDKHEIAALMDAESWISGEDAVERGFADALLPPDEIGEREASSKASNAVRAVEAKLTKSMSRSDARSLINEIKGKPGAALEATHDAGEYPMPEMASLLETLKG